MYGGERGFVAGKLVARSCRVDTPLQSPRGAQRGAHECNSGEDLIRIHPDLLDPPSRPVAIVIDLRAERRSLRTTVLGTGRTATTPGDHFHDRG